jgi:prepilin-type N-terminal cleavage/methylation domain-containing protein
MIRIREKINRENFQRESGLSLVELLIVITIIVIVSTIALMQFGSSKQQFSRQNVAQELKSSFERARFDSVKRRAKTSDGVPEASVVVNTNSISLTTYRESGGTYTAETKTTSFSGQNINLVSYGGTTLPVTVTYDRRGEATASSGNPVFLVCNGTCTASTDTAGNANIVLVTTTGTVNLLPGGSSIPTFAAPTLAGTPGGDIKNDVVLP